MSHLPNSTPRADEAAPSDHPWQATVLCVDDDPEIPRTIAAYLAGHGINVVKAFHGTHGLELARREQPDVILLDQSMPQGEGDTILQRLKCEPRTRPIPILVLTGRRDEELRRRLIDLGAECCFTKPVRLDDLFSALCSFIAIRETPVGRTSIHESNISHPSSERDL